MRFLLGLPLRAFDCEVVEVNLEKNDFFEVSEAAGAFAMPPSICVILLADSSVEPVVEEPDDRPRLARRGRLRGGWVVFGLEGTSLKSEGQIRIGEYPKCTHVRT